MTACRVPPHRPAHLCEPCTTCGHSWASHRYIHTLRVLECSLCELHAEIEAHLRQEADDG